MPNWCDNTVMIKGTKEEILRLKDSLNYDSNNNKNPFNFNAILPCPQVLSNESAPQRNEQRAAILRKKYGASDWYEWCNKNWGTKWNSSDATICAEYGNDDEYVVSYSFATAWAPPLPLYEVFAKSNANTNIYVCFDEPGCNFSGWRYYADGELQSEEDYESYSTMRTHLEPDSDIWDYV